MDLMLLSLSIKVFEFSLSLFVVSICERCFGHGTDCVK